VISKDHPNSSNDISYALYAAAGTNTPPAEHLLLGNTDVGVAASSRLTLNTWVHLAATYDGASMKMYVNGTLIRSVSKTGTITEVDAPLKIGGDWSGEMFTGVIDEVRVYNTALTQAQVQSDMNTPLDSTPPTVVLTAPAAGPVSGTAVTVAANASDNVAVVSVQFKLDGANLGAPVTSAPYQVTWNSTTATNMSHTLTAVATDTSGNSTSSAPVVVTVSNPDTTPPTVSILSPAAGAALTGTVNLTASASDNQAVASVRFLIDATNFGNPLTAAPYSLPWDTTTVGNGPHTITAIATDTGGNTNSASVAVTVSQNVDNVPPTVTITGPANNSALAGTFTLSATASDNVAVASVSFLVDGTNVGGPVTAAPYQVNWNSLLLPDGMHMITVTATDSRHAPQPRGCRPSPNEQRHFVLAGEWRGSAASRKPGARRNAGGRPATREPDQPGDGPCDGRRQHHAASCGRHHRPARDRRGRGNDPGGRRRRRPADRRERHACPGRRHGRRHRTVTR
jgi:hypothetical protein